MPRRSGPLRPLRASLLATLPLPQACQARGQVPGVQGREAMYDCVTGCGVDPRSLASRIMDIRSQLASEFVQDLKEVSEVPARRPLTCHCCSKAALGRTVPSTRPSGRSAQACISRGGACGVTEAGQVRGRLRVRCLARPGWRQRGRSARRQSVAWTPLSGAGGCAHEGHWGEK